MAGADHARGCLRATLAHPRLPAIRSPQNTLVWAITPLLVLLGWVRNMAGVSLISMLGNVSVLTGLVAVVCYALQLPSQLSAIPQVNFSGFGQVRAPPAPPPATFPSAAPAICHTSTYLPPSS